MISIHWLPIWTIVSWCMSVKDINFVRFISCIQWQTSYFTFCAVFRLYSKSKMQISLKRCWQPTVNACMPCLLASRREVINNYFVFSLWHILSCYCLKSLSQLQSIYSSKMIDQNLALVRSFIRKAQYNGNTSKTKLISIKQLGVTFLSPMHDANHQVRDSLRLHWLNFSADVNWNDYVESIARGAVKKMGSLCSARQLFYFTFL